MTTVQPKLISGIGGSAGSLNAYKALLNAMPHDTGMAFVFITHLMPDSHIQLANILQRQTKMSVLVAAEAMEILANHVYVIPSGSDFTLDNYRFKIISPRISRNKPVDVFFISLANEMSERAVGIVLSGYGADGTEGCRHIKANGGTTFAQDESAEVDAMPLSAKTAGCIDFVLPVDKIPAKLKKLVDSLER